MTASSSEATPEPVKKPKAKKQFLKEKAPVDTLPSSTAITDKMFKDLFVDIEAAVPGTIIPSLGVEIAVVRDWIPMPKEFCRVMDTPGLPCGHIVQVVGDSDTGKTTFCNHALAACQAEGGIAVLIDSEHKYSIDRAILMGVNRDRLIWKRVRTIEEAFEAMIRIINVVRAKRPNTKMCIVWDSVGGTPCLREIQGQGVDGEDEDDKEKSKEYAPAAAKAIKGGLRKTRYFLQEMNAALLLINQFYTRTDLKGPAAAFAKKKKAYGGDGPTYFSSVILEFTRIGSVKVSRKGKPVKVGTESKIECVKNHIGKPFKIVEIEIDQYGLIGADRAPDEAPAGSV